MVNLKIHGRFATTTVLVVRSVGNFIDLHPHNRRRNSNRAIRTSAANSVIFSNQDTIETPPARIIHQFAVCPIVLVLCAAPFHITADTVDVLLVHREAAPCSVFAQASNCASVILLTGGDASVDGDPGRLAYTDIQAFLQVEVFIIL